jgi:DNA-binding LacI/PurR family transcriptional regulator
MRVPISCVRQPITNIGFETVNRLMERLKESTENRVHRMLDCDFMERSSH